MIQLMENKTLLRFCCEKSNVVVKIKFHLKQLIYNKKHTKETHKIKIKNDVKLNF